MTDVLPGCHEKISDKLRASARKLRESFEETALAPLWNLALSLAAGDVYETAGGGGVDVDGAGTGRRQQPLLHA